MVRVVLVVVAVIVFLLLASVAFLMMNHPEFPPESVIYTIKAEKCGELLRSGCIANDTSGHFGCEAVSIGVDVTGDGNLDNLLDLARVMTHDSALDSAGCAKFCGCPQD